MSDPAAKNRSRCKLENPRPKRAELVFRRAARRNSSRFEQVRSQLVTPIGALVAAKACLAREPFGAFSEAFRGLFGGFSGLRLRKSSRVELGRVRLSWLELSRSRSNNQPGRAAKLILTRLGPPSVRIGAGLRSRAK